MMPLASAWVNTASASQVLPMPASPMMARVWRWVWAWETAVWAVSQAVVRPMREWGRCGAAEVGCGCCSSREWGVAGGVSWFSWMAW
ncbi:MAG: hypothetical protein H6668_05200 [Ardenticatenaceae bacterium]|nr:hypothetical protein [Ardenticatenaceae bacterium]